jgi:hypothetical protein
VQFQGSAIQVEHGGVTVATSKGMATNAGDWKITPASFSWTEFNVSDVDGTVRIIAKKGDLLISDGVDTTTLQQGQETQRDETSDNNKKKKKERPGANPAAGGGILNSPIAEGIGLGAIAGVTAWVLIRSDQPASPSKP